MEESRCPLCGGKLDMTDATDWGRSVRGDALARIACVGCGLSLTAPAEAFDGAWRALSGRGDRMTVQSIQRGEPDGRGRRGRPARRAAAGDSHDRRHRDGGPCQPRQGCGALAGEVAAGAVGGRSVACRGEAPERRLNNRGRSSPTAATRTRPYPHAVKTRRWKAMATLPVTARSTSERRWRTRVEGRKPFSRRTGAPSAVCKRKS